MQVLWAQGFVALYIAVSLRFNAVSGTQEKGPK